MISTKISHQQCNVENIVQEAVNHCWVAETIQEWLNGRLKDIGIIKRSGI